MIQKMEAGWGSSRYCRQFKGFGMKDRDYHLKKCQWRPEVHSSAWSKQWWQDSSCWGLHTWADRTVSPEKMGVSIALKLIPEVESNGDGASWKRMGVWRLKLGAAREHLGVCSLLLVSNNKGQMSVRVSGLVLVGTCEVLKEMCVCLSGGHLWQYCRDEGGVMFCNLIAIWDSLILLFSLFLDTAKSLWLQIAQFK